MCFWSGHGLKVCTKPNDGDTTFAYFWIEGRLKTDYLYSEIKGLILLLIFPVIVLVLVLVIVLLQCLPSSSVQSYMINIAKAL